MKRVLMLSYYFPPSRAAGTFRTLRFVRRLPELGWDVDVLTVRPSTYPRGELDPDLLLRVPDGVRVHRSSAPPWHRAYKNMLHFVTGHGRRRGTRTHGAAPPAGAASTGTTAIPAARQRSWSERFYDLLRTPDIDAGWRIPGLLAGLRTVLRVRPQVLYATGGPWTTFLVARDLSRLTGLPLVVDYRDPWGSNPASRQRTGWIQGRALSWERSVVRRARVILANTDVLRDGLVQMFGADLEPKIEVVTNSFDEEDFDRPAPPKPERFTLAYVGSLYEAHSPEPFLRALATVLSRRPELRPRFQVRLVGSGAPRTQQMVLGLGLDDVVEVHGPVSHEQAVTLQRAAHGLLLFLTVDSDHSTFIPSKLYEYLAARAPIFTVTRGGALERILRRHRITPWVHSPDDMESLVAGLEEYLDMGVRGALPQTPMQLAETFGSRHAARRLAAALERACTSGDRGPEGVAPETATRPLQTAGSDER